MLQIWASSQSPQIIMQSTAAVLGLPQNRCTARCRRMGGAFGGKTTRSAVPAAAVAVAANKLKKQVWLLISANTKFVCSSTILNTLEHTYTLVLGQRCGCICSCYLHDLYGQSHCCAPHSSCYCIPNPSLLLHLMMQVLCLHGRSQKCRREAGVQLLGALAPVP